MHNFLAGKGEGIEKRKALEKAAKLQVTRTCLLGSKKLGTNVLELQYVYIGKP